MTNTPNKYWESFEPREPITCLGDLHAFIESVADVPRLVWRGVADSTWGLHSFLYRYVTERLNRSPKPAEFETAEANIVTIARRWSLDRVPSGRSALELLAWLQHTGSPTRLIDVTLNPLVAAWFACDSSAGSDGRLFAIGSGEEFLIDDGNPTLTWESGSTLGYLKETSQTRVWIPPSIDPRISAQSGAFLIGPLPDSRSGGYWYKGDDSKNRFSADEVRRLTSVPIRAYVTVKPGETYRRNPLVSVRIAASAKRQLREALERVYNLTPLLLFPDPYGLAGHLKRLRTLTDAA